MKIALKIAVLMMVAGLFCGCAGTHEFGPYSGKVIDKETNEPIEGAVVFIRFFTQIGHFAGTTSYFADAVEVLTNSQGEFTVPVQRLRNTKFGHFWDKSGDVMVFKPGYGCYPGHRETEANPPEFPDNSNAIVKLPKLKTEEERKENLGEASYSRGAIPFEKQQHLLEFINQERINLGLEAIHPEKKPGGH